jgi:8-hydroxy-5-deazaflavin:NADPH oxidoreductase
MNIGIVGTGQMGRALGLRWAGAGHRVLFGSRDLNKAKAVAASAPGRAEAGDFDAAAAFGEVVLQIGRLGLGLYATISVHVLPERP